MKIEFEELEMAFSFVSAGRLGENAAYLDRETGKIHLHSGVVDNFEELPPDIGDEKYLSIPHKNDFNLGVRLVMDFTAKYLPEFEGEISEIFRRKGAYGKYKTLLERIEFLGQWYEFESSAHARALREWCAENGIELSN